MSVGESATLVHDEGIAETRWNAVERRLERWGECLNPILVKEARQALKSKQFTITFSLMLIAAWLWSLLGIVTRMPDIYYAPSGLNLLLGYYIILAVPLLLIVPFSAFRSLAAEREDLTYELLSISTLSSRQIVTGKLGSAILQMIVYYSALAPCIAFTYLLRGVDVLSVLLLLAYTFCLSVLLSCVGLVLAGVSRSRQWQSLLSVLLLLGLILVGFIWASMIVGIAFNGMGDIPLDNTGFWIAQAAVFTAFLTYVAVLILVASAQNSFASDNRSTRIRIAVSVQTVLFIGWVAYGWLYFAEDEMLYMALIFATIHWYVYGVLMSSESATLSPRVRRQLPRSFFGRVFLTWFNPGSGTGYIFAVSHVLVLSGFAAAAAIIQNDLGYPAPRYANAVQFDKMMMFVALLAGYYVAYIGFARIVVLLIPGRDRYGLPLPTLINLVCLALGCALPFFFESWRQDFLRIEYSPFQFTNWMWTLAEAIDNGLGDPSVVLLVSLGAIIILVINLMLTRAEIDAVRLESPERVKLDDESRTGQDEASHPDAF